MLTFIHKYFKIDKPATRQASIDWSKMKAPFGGYTPEAGHKFSDERDGTARRTKGPLAMTSVVMIAAIKEELPKLRRPAFWINLALDTLAMMLFAFTVVYTAWLVLAISYSWIWGVPIDLGHLLTNPFSDPVADYQSELLKEPALSNSLTEGFDYEFAPYDTP